MNKKTEIEIIKQRVNSKKQLKNCNLQKIAKIKAHEDYITTIANFPSGNFISLSWDKSIKIFDKIYRTIHHIKNAHNSWVRSVAIESDDFFITCSLDCSIKSWLKKENEYINHQTIERAHETDINKIIFSSNRYLLSCSDDHLIKIWKKVEDNKYKFLLYISHTDKVYSLLLFEDKNCLVSTGHYETKIWNFNINNLNDIKTIKIFDFDTYCECRNVLNRLDEDKFFVGGKNKSSLKIISISKNEILYTIEIPFQCLCIRTIYERGIFLVGGYSKDLLIFRSDNYELLQKYENAHEQYIEGITQLSNGLIATHGWD